MASEREVLLLQIERRHNTWAGQEVTRQIELAFVPDKARRATNAGQAARDRFELLRMVKQLEAELAASRAKECTCKSDAEIEQAIRRLP